MAKWLRGPRSEARERIVAILTRFNEIIRIEQEQQERHGWASEAMLGKLGIHYSHEQSSVVKRLTADFNRRLDRYNWGLALVTQVAAMGRGRLRFLVKSKIAPEEIRALNAIASLSAQGLLTRLRQCQQCRRWFFARFEHHRSCATHCRIKYSQSKPGWREKHNEKRRENYQWNKVRKYKQRERERRKS